MFGARTEVIRLIGLLGSFVLRDLRRALSASHKTAVDDDDVDLSAVVMVVVWYKHLIFFSSLKGELMIISKYSLMMMRWSKKDLILRLLRNQKWYSKRSLNCPTNKYLLLQYIAKKSVISLEEH
jgi:hypothetical protein